MLSGNQIKNLFRQINVWSRGDERAPHKPLLILLALGRLLKGESRQIPFTEIENPLRKLLEFFGPPRKIYHPEYPFWRLQADGVWEVITDHNLTLRDSNTDPLKSELIKYKVPGGFPGEIFEFLQNNPEVVSDIVSQILTDHFPESMHQEIRQETGLSNISNPHIKRPRNPEFRRNVLRAYQHRCAICGFNIQLENQTVGLEAGHVKWHQYLGPDEITNGLALCSIHHKTFDRGAFTVSTEYFIQVSEHAHGNNSFHEILLRHHNQPLADPIRQEYKVLPEHLNWHEREVFRNPPRE